MTGTGRTNPLAARSTVRCFCRNTLQDRLHLSQALSEPPGMIDAPFSAPSSPPETPAPTKRKPFFSANATRRWCPHNWNCHRQSGYPFGQMGKQLFHQLIHRTASTNHHHYFAGYGNGSYKFGYICIAFNFFPFGAAVHKTFHHPSSTPGTVRLYTETFHPLSAILRPNSRP